MKINEDVFYSLNSLGILEADGYGASGESGSIAQWLSREMSCEEAQWAFEHELWDIPKPYVLIGSSFPMSITRSRVEVEPIDLDTFKAEIDGLDVVSAWQHSNTLVAVKEYTGLDLTPPIVRPRIRMTEDTKRPCIEWEEWRFPLVFSKMYAVIPLYKEVVNGVPDVTDWNILRLSWTENTKEVSI